MGIESLILAAIIFISYTTQAITGFGAVVIAVTLGAQFIPIEELVPVLIPMSMTLTSYLTLRYRRHIDLALLLKLILPVMGAGMALGLLGFDYLKGAALVMIFGSMVVLLSLRELWSLFFASEFTPETALPRAPQGATVPVNDFERENDIYIDDNIEEEILKDSRRFSTPAWVFGAGIFHGIYGSGGPMLVYALGKLGLDKARFRATLAAVWLTLNAFMTVAIIYLGRLNLERAEKILYLLPALPLGVVLGEYLHHRISERNFRIVTFLLLLFAGAALLIRRQS